MKEMKTAVYGPMNMVTAHFEEVRQSFYYKTVLLTWSYNSSIRAVLELFCVFDALPVDGTNMSATALPGKLQVEEALLGRNDADQPLFLSADKG